MKILHLSDLHLGKRVFETSMLPEQRAILSQALDMADLCDEGDGEIVNGGSGAGSGEIILTVSARRNGKPVSFDYIFYGSELEYVLQTDK